MKLPCRYQSLPTPIPYDEAYALQLAVHGQRARNEVVDTLLLLEHPAVITVGRGSKGRGDLLTSPEELNRKGIAYVETDRGGEMTYHAPGQLVGYAIMDLSARGRDLHVFLRDLEQTIIDTLAEFDVTGSRKPGLTGVWVGEQKICAMGIKVSRWVSMHGFALNIAPNMAPFREDLIPCGIRDKGVVSLAELGRSVNRSTIEMAYLRSFANVFNVDIAAANVSATTI